MTRIVLFLCLALAVPFIPISSATAQSTAAPTQSTPTPEAARIDQLLRENRTLMFQGKFDEVMKNAEQALSLSQQTGDLVRQSRVTLQIGTAAYHNGQTEIALESFRRAASLAEQAGENSLLATALYSAGPLLTSAGEFEEALSFYNKSLALKRLLNDRRGEATVLSSMSQLFLLIGEVSSVDGALQDALIIVRELKAKGENIKQLEDYILTQIAYGQYLRGNHSAAITAYQNAIANETPTTSGAVKLDSRQMMIIINTSMEKWERVEELSRDALNLARTLKIPDAEDLGLAYLGWAQFHLGNPKAGLDNISQAVALSRQNADRIQEVVYLGFLGEVQRALGQGEAAASTYRQAVNLVEFERMSMIPTETSRGGWVSTHHRIFSGAIESLAALGKESEALQIAEKYHARAFLDVLAESRIDLRRDLKPEQKQQEESILKRITALQKELWNPKLEKGREPQMRKDLAQAEQQLEDFKLELRRANPRYASFKYPSPLTAEQIAREVLEDDTALIEFVMSEKRSFAWVIHRGKISTIVLSSQKELEGLLGDYRAALSEKVSAVSPSRAIARINDKGRAVYQKLIAPIESHLTTARKLIIVPDGALSYLPFETLSRERLQRGRKPADEYLVERFSISYAPSASALAMIKKYSPISNAGTKGIVAFGDPAYRTFDLNPQIAVSAKPSGIRDALLERGFEFNQLPYTRAEVRAIASLFKETEQQTFLGSEAREDRVKTVDLSALKYVHFAAHGMIDEEFPARSGIVLSASTNSKDDGVLQVSEVMRLKLNADLVTLSACRTGLGKLLNGEGMIGLTRAFHYAGARSVVVSLWNVNDIATAELMKAFYQNLMRGQAKDEALRQAKLQLLKGKHLAWRHPYYWAPFVLAGANN